jgi:2'-5' RNA ligase
VSAESARLFVALELPRPAREALWRWAGEHLRGITGVRIVDPVALHVTLCFLGSRPVSEIDRIAAECSVVADQAAVALALGAPLWLPHRRPRVVAVALEDPGGRLAALQSRLSDALQAAEVYEPERRPFLGHVTVGRIGRTGRDAKVRARELVAPEPVRFSAGTVALFRSRTGRAGARYEPLASVQLRR